MSTPGPDAAAADVDIRSPRGGTFLRLSDWRATIAIVSCLILLAVVRGLTLSEQIHMAIRWLSIAILVASAWICPPRVSIAATFISLVTWSWIETQRSDWTDWYAGHLVRLLVAMGLVIWLVRLREQLATARRLARVDGLTGLPNRQALIESLEAEIGRSRRFGRPFSVAVMDCDGFKQINDSRGHLVGDEVLRRIGTSLRQQTRPFDCAGRWGGDEFLMVLSEADCDDAQLIAERLRAAMRHNVERDFPSLTFSLGVVTIRNSALEWQECVQQADDAMYAAKRLGRNQTRFDMVGTS